MSFLFNDSNALMASWRAGKASSNSSCALSAMARHLTSSSAIFSLRVDTDYKIEYNLLKKNIKESENKLKWKVNGQWKGFQRKKFKFLL